jgi:DnaJ-like protein
MNDALTECYDLLGLSPGASSEELKAAHRDLAKVWHPDRFLHDPRLQEKAQEKLKQINEAYEQLRSGKAKRQRQPSASTRERYAPPTPSHFDQHAQAHTQTGRVAKAQGIRWQLILAPVLIFAVAFLVTSRSLLRPSEWVDQSQVPAIEQGQDPSNPEPQQPGSRVNTSANELPPGNARIEAKSQREESGEASTSQPSAAPLRPLPTVTIVIDPATGMIARRDCPMKTRMTYPSGSEPHQYCTAHPGAPSASAAPADASGPKESRLKSAAKRLASPGKWFGGKANSDGENKQDSKSPDRR